MDGRVDRTGCLLGWTSGSGRVAAIAKERKNQERLLEIWLEGIRVYLVSIPKIKRQTNNKNILETYIWRRKSGVVFSL